MQLSPYRAMNYAGSSPEAKAAVDTEQKADDIAEKLSGHGVAADPALNAQITDITSQYDKLHTMLNPAIVLALADKDKEAMAMVILTQTDFTTDAVAKQVTALNDATMAKSEKVADELTVMAKSNNFWLLSLSLLGVVASVAVSLAVSRVGITGSLERPKSAMEALAGGNNAVAIDGAERGDEVGAMAKVVAVFRSPVKLTCTQLSGSTWASRASAISMSRSRRWRTALSRNTLFHRRWPRR